MTSDSSRDTDREQELRRLLTEAVEPVAPAPGAQTRLLARARAQQRHRQRPLMARLGVPAAVASLIAVVVLAVVFVGHLNRGSSGSSASTVAGGALPSRAPGSSAAATSANAAAASPKAPVPSSKDLSGRKGASTTFNGTGTSATEPQAESLASDLDGDGRPDSFTLSAAALKAQLSLDGAQTVILPPLGPGARVLGVASLRDAGAKPVPVVFVRLRQAGSTATDTLVSVVGGSLTVLEQGSGPALLTIDASHGYACDDNALLVTGSPTPYVVYGADLVASPGLRVALAAAAPAKATGCVTP